MPIALLVATLALAAVAVVLLAVLLSRRPPAPDLSALATRADAERAERTARDEANAVRALVAEQSRQLREELDAALQRSQANATQQLEQVRGTVHDRLRELQESNAKKLDEMRATVDTQLKSTLEQRLGESFRQVSQWLEQVHKGLGEMQALAGDVGDLKKVMTNVKARGTWGEVQLGALLELVLSPEHYAANVCTKGEGREVVEFAVELPGDGNGHIWLPIDSKFPLEDYARLTEAQEAGDREAADEAGKALELRVRNCAKDIREKYVSPPGTTDFGVLFLPTESLYAEVLRRPGFVESLQAQYNVTVTGPTTLCAFLNSLRMGFRTLAIQKRSSEVWETLGQVKTEFGKFETILDKIQKKLEETQNVVADASRRSRVLTRKLGKVEALPAVDAELLALPDEIAMPVDPDAPLA